MHVYKLRPRDFGAQPIGKAVFERDTGRKKPWYAKDGKKERQFAVCPACDTPIRIVGLYEPLPHTARPYGRHTGKPVEWFSYYDPEAYAWCPYVKKRPSGSGHGKRKLNGLSLKILGLVLNQFDRIVYILDRETGLRLSRKFAGDMLTSWLAGEGYLYPGATLRNVPWMVAYRSRGLSIFGQKIAANEKLKEAVRLKIPAARIDDGGRISKGNAFYEIDGAFLDHRVSRGEGDLVETVRFEVWSGRRKNGQRNIIHSKTIRFDPEFFERLVNLPPERAKRNERLLDLAEDTYRETLGPDLLARVREAAENYGPELPV